MRQNHILRLAAGAALGALILTALPGSPLITTALAAASSAAEAAAKPQFLGFAGAFLAARTADFDNDTDSAITFYRKALEFDPGNPEIRQRLMVTLFTAGRFEEGVALARDMKNDPAVAQVSDLALAIDAINKRDYETASSLLDADSTNPIDRLLNTLLKAWADFGAGKGKEALAAMAALDGPPWYPVFLSFHTGAMAQAMGDTDAARKAYIASVSDKPSGGAAPDTYIRTVMALAALDGLQGNTRGALDALSSGEDFSPGYAPLAAMRQQIEDGKTPEADIETAQQGAAAALFTLGSALNREGAEETVALYLQFARALDPEDAATLVMLGSLKEALGKPEDAIAIYKSVPENSPMRRVSELQLGLALADMGDDGQARDHLKALIASDPKDLRSYLAYGTVLSSDKDYLEMALNYQTAIAVVGPAPSKSDWNLFFQLGIAQERLKEWPKAETNFKRALQLYPQQPQVMNYLGYSWIDMNMNLDEGMAMIQAAVDIRPNDGYIVDSLGWAYYRLGKYDDAVRELERAIELKPADVTINDHLGDAYWRVGRELEATFQWKRALINDPDEDVREAINKKLAEGLPKLDQTAPAANGVSPATDTQPDATTETPLIKSSIEPAGLAQPA